MEWRKYPPDSYYVDRESWGLKGTAVPTDIWVDCNNPKRAGATWEAHGLGHHLTGFPTREAAQESILSLYAAGLQRDLHDVRKLLRWIARTSHGRERTN